MGVLISESNEHGMSEVLGDDGQFHRIPSDFILREINGSTSVPDNMDLIRKYNQKRLIELTEDMHASPPDVRREKFWAIMREIRERGTPKAVDVPVAPDTPSAFIAIASLVMPPESRDAVLGDVLERFGADAKRLGEKKATLRMAWELILILLYRVKNWFQD